MAQFDTYLQLTDIELVEKIKDNADALGIVFKKCKSSSMSFMRKMTGANTSDFELEDVFQDAIIIFYEKILKGNFVLTAAIQTYINSVCRYQLLNKIKVNKLTTVFEDQDLDDEGKHMSYDVNITDTLDEIEDQKEAKFIALEKALEMMKAGGGKCYDLLIQFWYHKKSSKELAEIFDYSNDKTAKKQKSQCQDKLRVLTFNTLKN